MDCIFSIFFEGFNIFLLDLCIGYHLANQERVLFSPRNLFFLDFAMLSEANTLLEDEFIIPRIDDWLVGYYGISSLVVKNCLQSTT